MGTKERAEILCPDCGKLITVVSVDSSVTIYGWCKRCRQEKKITYPEKGRANEPLKR